MFVNIEIMSVDPHSVYIFPNRYTIDGIKKNVDILHKLADAETDGTIFCFGDDLNYSIEKDFEICYPMLKNDYKKYNIHNFKVIQRRDVVIGEYQGQFEEIATGLHKLKEFAENEGYEIELPYCIVYKKGKKPKFSKNPPPFVMHFYIPVVKKS